jgi:hypothetical protein
LAGCVQYYESVFEIRATTRAFRGPGDRQAPIFRQRAKVGFGGECGNSRAPRADGTHASVWDRRSKQLARMERDLAAHTTALETADAAKWVNRQEYCLTQPRATISMSMSTSLCGRSVTESAERRRGPLPHWTPKSGGWDRPGFVVVTLGAPGFKFAFFYVGPEQLEAAEPKRQPVRAAAS